MLIVIPQFKHYQVVRPYRYNDKKNYDLIVQSNWPPRKLYQTYKPVMNRNKFAEGPGETHKMKVGFFFFPSEHISPRKCTLAELGRPGKQYMAIHI